MQRTDLAERIQTQRREERYSEDILGNDKEMSRRGKAESGEQRKKNEPEKHVENLEGDGGERLGRKKERRRERRWEGQ